MGHNVPAFRGIGQANCALVGVERVSGWGRCGVYRGCTDAQDQWWNVQPWAPKDKHVRAHSGRDGGQALTISKDGISVTVPVTTLASAVGIGGICVGG